MSALSSIAAPAALAAACPMRANWRARRSRRARASMRFASGFTRQARRQLAGDDGDGRAGRGEKGPPSAPTPIPTGYSRSCRNSIVAATSLQIATEPLPAALRGADPAGRRSPVRHAQSHPLLAARRGGAPADGRARALSRARGPKAIGRISSRDVSALYPALRGIALHPSLGRPRGDPSRLLAAAA